MTVVQQAIAVAKRDLLIEARTSEVILITLPFSAAALILIPLAIGTDAPLLTQIGAGMFFTLVLLFGVLVVLRKSASEGGPQRDVMRLLGLDPVARLAGSATATAALLLLFEIALVPIVIVLYNPILTGWWWLIVILPLVAIGLAILGTIASTLTISLGTRTSLTPLLIVPVALPLLLGATQALEGLRLGRSIIPWLVLLAAVDLSLAVAGVLASKALEEAV